MKKKILDNAHKLIFIKDQLINQNLKIDQSNQYNLVKVEIFQSCKIGPVLKSKILQRKNNKILIILILKKIIIIII